MAIPRKWDFDWRPDRSGVRQWIFLALLMCLIVGCLGIHMSLLRMTRDMQTHQRKLQAEIKDVKAREHSILDSISRINLQQENVVQRQNDLVDNLASQVEVLFDDIEIASRMLRQKPIILLEESTSLKSLNEMPELSYKAEYLRRRIETIVGELWNFVDDELRNFRIVFKHVIEDVDLYNSREKLFTKSLMELDTDLVIEEPPMQNGSDFVMIGDDNTTSKEESTMNGSYIKETLVDIATASIQGNLTRFKQELGGYRRALLDTFDLFKKVDHADKRRLMMSKELGNLVQSRLRAVQNPSECNVSGVVVCQMKSCGFGCQFHHFMYCLIAAYAKSKAMITNKQLPWVRLFLAATESCKHLDQRLANSEGSVEDQDSANNNTSASTEAVFREQDYIRLETLPFVEYNTVSLDYFPLSIPEDLAPLLATFHGNPAVWWTGQIASFLFNPTSELMDHFKYVKRTLGFQKPIVGVHVRRSDKILSEAKFHHLNEYMQYVNDYYEQLERSTPNVSRRVFLATDDASVLSEARSAYPNYVFISDNNASKVSLDERNTVDALKGVTADIYFLSRSDFLVCTFSSQVCRLAYELMQTLHGDASQYFRSLDDIYYYGGQHGHEMTVLESHQSDPSRPNTIDIMKGDTIYVQGNHWNGFSKGTNARTGEEGLYPSYKVEEHISTFTVSSAKKTKRKRKLKRM